VPFVPLRISLYSLGNALRVQTKRRDEEKRKRNLFETRAIFDLRQKEDKSFSYYSMLANIAETPRTSRMIIKNARSKTGRPTHAHEIHRTITFRVSTSTYVIFNSDILKGRRALRDHYDWSCNSVLSRYIDTILFSCDFANVSLLLITALISVWLIT